MKARRLLFALGVLGSVASCEYLEQPDTDPPVLYNVGIDLGAYDAGTRRAGAFVLDTALTSIFTELGDAVGSRGFSYVVSSSAEILSPIAGTVASLSLDEVSEGYTVKIRPKTDSVWTVRIDHLRAPAVVDGESLAAGDPLGLAGAGAPAGRGRMKLRVDDTEEERSWCPFALFDEATVGTNATLFVTTLQQFEVLKGDASLWDEGAWPFPGCRDETVSF